MLLLLCRCCYLCGGMWWYAWLCVNAWGIYSVKPTWRHGTAPALTSLISIQLWGDGRLRRAESVLQNCVMGRCAICIFMYCYTSLNRNIGKVRIPSVFNKFLKSHTQIGKPHSSMPLFTCSFNRKDNSSHLQVFIYNSSVSPMFTHFKLQDNWIFRSEVNRKLFSHITKCHLVISEGWRRN